ncbi:MAG: hypothetical protein JSS27_21430 [Planctomycetes bacterium]|nr:hypothetical protein [Planctomycetota bacterium]
MTATGRQARRSPGLPLAAVFLATLLLSAPTSRAADEAKPLVVRASAARIDELINRLGHNDYFVRQQAQDELSRVGLDAFDALTRAENSDDIEVSERARYLVRLLRFEIIADSDPPDVRKLLQTYKASEDEQRQLIAHELAQLPDDRGLPALCRIVRYDRSQVVSKYAALAIIEQKNISDARAEKRKAVLLSMLAQSPRPAAEWLRNYVAQRGDTTAAAALWSRLASEEAQTLRSRPQQSRAELVIGLLKVAVAANQKLGRQSEVDRALQQMVAVEPSDDTMLGDLVAWLIDQKAWTVIDEISGRYPERFNASAILLYHFAEAQLAQGREAQAEEAAQRAVKMSRDEPDKHYIMAYQLRRRGMRRWAEMEYRRVIEIGPPAQAYALQSQAYLADMLHDSGEDGKGAKVLAESVAAMEQAKNAGQQTNINRDLRTTRGQMHFLYACDAREQGNDKEYKRHLLAARDEDPTNADVLIALFRLPDADAALKQSTQKLIRDSAELFRRRIQEEPDQALNYNQLAWLIGNTEGDYQEALRSSHKSLEMQPNEAGYLDTLGRCYYAVKDLDNAIKYQSQAVELDPHSGLMRKQLQFFKKSRAEARGEKPEQPAPAKRS